MSRFIYIVLSELLDGYTADGEHVVVISAHEDRTMAERRVEFERASGHWGQHESDDEPHGWHVRIERVELISERDTSSS